RPAPRQDQRGPRARTDGDELEAGARAVRRAQLTAQHAQPPPVGGGPVGTGIFERDAQPRPVERHRKCDHPAMTLATAVFERAFALAAAAIAAAARPPRGRRRRAPPAPARRGRARDAAPPGPRRGAPRAQAPPASSRAPRTHPPGAPIAARLPPPPARRPRGT